MAQHTVVSRLRFLVSGGLSTSLIISVTTGISEAEIALILEERIQPTTEQEKRLRTLLINYER
jgi:hypothetical protein